jgi:LPXTG-site transpeptidase (sortase) family protein
VSGRAAHVLAEAKEFVERLEALPAGDAVDPTHSERLDEARVLLRAIVAEGGTLMFDAADLLRRSLVIDLRIAQRTRAGTTRPNALASPLLPLNARAARSGSPPTGGDSPVLRPGLPLARALRRPATPPRYACNTSRDGKDLTVPDAAKQSRGEVDHALDIAEFAKGCLTLQLRQITLSPPAAPGQQTSGGRGEPATPARVSTEGRVSSSSPRLRPPALSELAPTPRVLPAPARVEDVSRSGTRRPSATALTPCAPVGGGSAGGDLKVLQPAVAPEQATPPRANPLQMSGRPPVQAVTEVDETAGAESAPATRARVRAGALAAARAVGIVLVGFVVYALFISSYTEGFVQRRLDPRSHLRISVPNIGLDQFVLASDSRSALAKGPGLVAGLPGGAQPIIIAGHRTTNGAPFRHLSALQPGSSVVLRTDNGKTFDYIVLRVVTVGRHAELSAPAGSQTLFLLTATPAYNDSKRVVVVARLVSAGPSTEPYRVTLPALEGSRSDLALAVLGFVLLGAMWAVRAVSRESLRRWIVWACWIPALALAYATWQLLLGSMSRVL